MNNQRFTDFGNEGEKKTFIGTATRFVGEVEGDYDFHLEGEMEGKIKLNALLTIGENGKLKGEVVAENVLVEGTVDGEVVARNKIEIRTTGNFKGNIICKQIAIADGAFFQGSVKMEDGNHLNPTYFKEKREDLKK